VIERTKALKGGDLGKILVSAIAGPPTPYQVVTMSGTTSTGVMEDQPWIKHSCVAQDMSSGDPGVRIKMWVDAFHGTFTTICDRTFEPALTQIVNAIGTAMGPACVEGKVVDADPLTPGLQPNCSFETVTIDAQGNKTKTAIPSCEKSGGLRPCWSLSSDTQRCPGNTGLPQTLLTIASDGPMPADLAQYEISCAVCEPSASSSDGCRY